jgi:hypothetical protein
MNNYIENFNLKYENFFDEQNYLKRWNALIKIYRDDYDSFRVLFEVETLALLDEWKEPTIEKLQKLLKATIRGTRIVVRVGRLFDLVMPIWPLEIAKFEVQLLRILLNNRKKKEYILTYLKIWSVSLIQTWWAFETLMNDFAGIIREQRVKEFNQDTLNLLDEIYIILDGNGMPSKRSYYQAIDARIKFIYNLLTGQRIDSGSREWQNLKILKMTRDSYIHRIGKDSQIRFDENIVFNGLRSVQKTISDILLNTPEFSKKFVYKYLSFWCCQTETPFFWDGRNGDGVYLGLAKPDLATILSMYAPKPGSFGISDK